LKIIIDLDNTITVDVVGKEYPDKPVNELVRRSIAKSAELGCEYEIFTARNMRRYNGDLEKINSKTVPIINEWLDEHAISVSKIHVGKPYPGKRGIYVDDRSVFIGDYIESYETGFLSTKNLMVLPFTVPLKNLDRLRYQLMYLINKTPKIDIMLVQNGKNDDLKAQLAFIVNTVPHCSLIEIDANIGLGGAYKHCFDMKNLTDYDYIVLGHGNDKLDIKGFLTSFSDQGYKLDEQFYFITDFVNRSVMEIFFSRCISFLTSVKLKRRIKISNPGIKIFPSRILSDNPLRQAPNDYTIDLWLQCFVARSNTRCCPVEQLARKSVHNSTWKRSLSSYLSMIHLYILTISKL